MAAAKGAIIVTGANGGRGSAIIEQIASTLELQWGAIGNEYTRHTRDLAHRVLRPWHVTWYIHFNCMPL